MQFHNVSQTHHPEDQHNEGIGFIWKAHHKVSYRTPRYDGQQPYRSSCEIGEESCEHRAGVVGPLVLEESAPSTQMVDLCVVLCCVASTVC